MVSEYHSNSDSYSLMSKNGEQNCFEYICPASHYCSGVERKCLKCYDICQPKSITFDYELCSAKCSDTITLRSEIRTLRVQFRLCATLIGLILTLGVIYLIGKGCRRYAYRRRDKMILKNSLAMNNFSYDPNQNDRVFTIPVHHPALPDYSFGRHNPSFTMTCGRDTHNLPQASQRLPSEDVCESDSGTVCGSSGGASTSTQQASEAPGEQASKTPREQASETSGEQVSECAITTRSLRDPTESESSATNHSEQ